MSLFSKINLFTWWNGVTFGTLIGLSRKTRVGDDTQGNAYYEGGKMADGRTRRFVVYAGANDSSRVPPEWHSWLHHQSDDVPDRAFPAPRAWQLPAEPNLTGTDKAYRPAGALERGGVRAAATGDYEAWDPAG